MSGSPRHIERVWIAIAPDGTEHELAVRVGYPESRPEGDWVSRVSMGPLDHREFEIHGMDSWQALEQGMNHAAVLAQHYHGKGWRYLWERGGEEALPSELACGTAKF